MAESMMVELVEQAMMAGFAKISKQSQSMFDYYAAHPHAPAADMYRAALDDYAAQFVQLRGDLVDAVETEILTRNDEKYTGETGDHHAVN